MYIGPTTWFWLRFDMTWLIRASLLFVVQHATFQIVALKKKVCYMYEKCGKGVKKWGRKNIGKTDRHTHHSAALMVNDLAVHHNSTPPAETLTPFFSPISVALPIKLKTHTDTLHTLWSLLVPWLLKHLPPGTNGCRVILNEMLLLMGHWQLH